MHKSHDYKSMDNPNSYEHVAFSCNEVGYILLGLLNMDIGKVCSCMLADKQNYHTLASQNDVLKLYLFEESEDLLTDLSNDTSFSIHRIKEYISFCNDNKFPYHTKFFDYLNRFEYFGSYFEIPETGSVSNTLFDIDEEFTLRSTAVGLASIYDSFISSGLSINSVEYTTNSYNRFATNILSSLCEIDKIGKRVLRCKNCGKFFFPANRSDEIYCDNSSPQDQSMTCKQYGTNRLWYEKQKENEIALLSRKIASAKGMLAKRNPDRPEYAAYYEYFKEQRRDWIKALKDGNKTPEEYKKWLLFMKEHNTLKAAGICNNGE